MKSYIITEQQIIDIYYSGYDRDQLDHYLRGLPLSGETPESNDNEWWCPHCRVAVPPDSVTYEETHDAARGGCGRTVEPSRALHEAINGSVPTEHVSPTPEADPQPEAPKDWSGHPEYEECVCCVHIDVNVNEEPCHACMAAYSASRQLPHWQPRAI